MAQLFPQAGHGVEPLSQRVAFFGAEEGVELGVFLEGKAFLGFGDAFLLCQLVAYVGVEFLHEFRLADFLSIHFNHDRVVLCL